MQVINPNEIKIYNLSSGKSLPEWLSDARKRKLLKQDADLQKRIELIQDFEMPVASHCIQVSPDGQYVFATGVYKPRIRCFDVQNLSLKFERFIDSEVKKMKIFSQDYSKLAVLTSDRYIEFHGQGGRHYRLRMPKFGRDMSYHQASCDLYCVGYSSEIYRLNLERGRFLNSISTNCMEFLCSEFNEYHDMLACGSSSGELLCFDPRVRQEVGRINCLPSSINPAHSPFKITSLKFKDALTIGIGTSDGQIMIYDVRGREPLLVKDHNNERPIKKIHFHSSSDLVMSIDEKILKIWHEQSGKPYTAIESEGKLNDMCLYTNSGLIMMANEEPKMQIYYIPALGTAPKWCSFLDSLTEELEERPHDLVYDDYKFLTRTELESLGLTNLIGTNLLKAYMHGYFMDLRLYNKAKTIVDPFAYKEYRKQKIRQKIEQSSENRVVVKSLPKVNTALAERLLDGNPPTRKRNKGLPNLLADDRFKRMFNDPDFQIDTQSETYRLINPVVASLNKKMQETVVNEKFETVQENEINQTELEGHNSSSEEESSDDERPWSKNVQREHQKIHQEKMQLQKTAFMELKSGEDPSTLMTQKSDTKARAKRKNQTFEDRLTRERPGQGGSSRTGAGNMAMTFDLKSKDKSADVEEQQKEARVHHQERKALRRPVGDLAPDRQAQMAWMRMRRGQRRK